MVMTSFYHGTNVDPRIFEGVAKPMPDENPGPVDLKELDDETLFELTVKLRDMIPDAGEHVDQVKDELRNVECERIGRRITDYEARVAASSDPAEQRAIGTKIIAAHEGLTKLKAEGFSDEVQRVGG